MDKSRHDELVRNRNIRLIESGICIACGKNKIDYSRSNCRCSYCLDKRNKYQKNIYYPDNKENIQKSQKICRIKNPFPYREKGHRYYIKNKDRYFQYVIDRRGRKLQADGKFTDVEWEELLMKFKYRCLWCGTNKNIEADHIIPLSKNGRNSIDNIQSLCRNCNARKHTKIIDFRSFGSSIMEWT